MQDISHGMNMPSRGMNIRPYCPASELILCSYFRSKYQSSETQQKGTQKYFSFHSIPNGLTFLTHPADDKFVEAYLI